MEVIMKLTSEEFLEFFPEAKEGGGEAEGAANECICMFAEDEADFFVLGLKLTLDVPGVINSILPLVNDNYGWDDAHTMMALVGVGSRGILKFEKGMNDKNGNQTDCFYIRFFAFKTADVPFSGSSWLIKEVCDALVGCWANTKIVSDTARNSATRVIKRRQSEEWRSQGLCSSCGGQLGFMKKCKSCGRKN